MKDVQIGDRITLYIPGEDAQEEVTIMHIPQVQGQQWIFKRDKKRPDGQEWMIGINTFSPITKCK